jgi:oxygen-independent coproporphyrinogen-3 oxidase
MSEKDLIKRAREIQRELNTEREEMGQIGLKIEDYEQRGRYIYYLKSGSRIRSKDIFSSYDSQIQEINLYIHLPFCTHRCTYCCCYNVGIQPETVVAEYISLLQKELELLIESPPFKDTAVRYIYFGGGTPTCLSAKQLSGLIGYLKSRLNVLPEASFTCETSPERIVGSAGKERLHALLENGVKRLSIGVQSFDDSILRLVGRRHGSETAISAYRNACEAGFTNTNIDLIFGLPGQTLEKWERDLEIITDLNPGWVSVYRLRFENPIIHTTFMKEPHLFPDREIVLLMNIMAIEQLTDQGYEQAQAPCTFLLPSKLEYVPRLGLGRATVGIGASAWSYVNGVKYTNFFDLKRYKMSIDKGRLPISFAGKYSKRQQIEREIVTMLKSSTGVNKSDFNSHFAIDIDRLFRERLQKLKKLGMIKDDGETYRLSKKGLLFSVEVFKQFYPQDYADRLKNVVYKNGFLKTFFLNKKYGRSVGAVSNIVKTIGGFTK